MQILRDAQYGGAWESETGYTPLAYGSFERFKAVYKEGYITCDTRISTGYPWQECMNFLGLSFELKKNHQYVLEGNLPPLCAHPIKPTGDIVCEKTLSLNLGDTLTPTWYEASHQVSTADNGGTITIDLFGWTDVSIHHGHGHGLFILATYDNGK